MARIRVGKMKIPAFEGIQRRYCFENNQQCEITREDDIVGFAVETQGKIPVNGLRHLKEDETSGWYIWCGEEFSSRPDFFSPIHAEHLVGGCPEIVKLLGLPLGFRFLLAGDHVDVWFDESVLII